MPDVVYGGSTADFTYGLAPLDVNKAFIQAGGVALTVWTAETGGTQVGSTTSSAAGDIRFTISYPDANAAPASLWVDAGSGRRWRIDRDVTQTLQGAASVTYVDGQVAELNSRIATAGASFILRS